jgi:hypothetical protein
LALIGMVLLVAAVGVLGYIASTQRKQMQTPAVGLANIQKEVFDSNEKISALQKEQDAKQKEAVAKYTLAQQFADEQTAALKAGDTKRATEAGNKAKAARTEADVASQSYNQINSQIQQQQQIATGAKQRAEDLGKLLPTGGGVPTFGSGSGIGTPPTGRGDATTTAPPPTPPPTPPPDTGPVKPKTGSYKDSFKRGITALNRKQFAEAKKNFEEAIADYGVDTGESINISGFGNNRPYVPKFFLGVALSNLNDCPAALRLWAESENAIKKAGLSKSLDDERAKCPKQRTLLRQILYTPGQKWHGAARRQVVQRANSADFRTRPWIEP